MDPPHRRMPASDNTSSSKVPPPPPGGAPPATTRVPPPGAPSGAPSRIQQPKPQPLPSRQGPNSILVSPRQKGNPILNHIQSVPWEYSDIPSDYVLGSTTCALFLSLKYHRLHPEYIYGRIRLLSGKYRLRILLTMVDIENHEESLKEISKTSLINNFTVILCWSSPEAGRYLSLFKTFEFSSSNSIRAQQPSGYTERLVEFVTTPKSVNKTDAISLVGNFGSLRNAVNAHPEEIGMIAGWGDRKVANWSASVNEGFRTRRAKKRGGPGALSREVTREEGEGGLSRDGSRMEEEVQVESGDEQDEILRRRVGVPPQAIPLSMVPSRETTRGGGLGTSDADRRPPHRLAEVIAMREPGSDEEEALLASIQADNESSVKPSTTAGKQQQGKSKGQEEEMGEGIMAALAKLRERG
ncbi:MAG: hypothetical protein M1823_005018 [Watsoniomyces obsoletus]|nr:MAG: hypothetical protein M1823_005018 [Watsoniomyces obsoletus]